MKIYQVPPIVAAIFFSALSMGAVGVFVVIPIAFIQWTWNCVVVGISSAPHISVWQALLLYLAGATVLYLSGIVQIKIETTNVD